MSEKSGKSCLKARRNPHGTNKFDWKALPCVCVREMFITSIHSRYILYIELVSLKISRIAVKRIKISS